jgi:hypothetical protein
MPFQPPCQIRDQHTDVSSLKLSRALMVYINSYFRAKSAVFNPIAQKKHSGSRQPPRPDRLSMLKSIYLLKIRDRLLHGRRKHAGCCPEFPLILPQRCQPLL